MHNPAALVALAKGDFENAAIASRPGGIEAQERSGQQALVGSMDMPKELHPSREAFEKLGFTFGDDVDELFVKATLPAGWTRSATSHAMHSDILDGHGRKRVGIFYKAAFYDRRADANLVNRFHVRLLYGEERPDLPKDMEMYAVFDCDKIIHVADPHPSGNWQIDDARRNEAFGWLKSRYPDIDDPTANW